MNALRIVSRCPLPVLGGLRHRGHAQFFKIKPPRPQLRQPRSVCTRSVADANGETYLGVYGPWKIGKEDLIEASF